MAELVDALDSGSSGATHTGSNPAIYTITKARLLWLLILKIKMPTFNLILLFYQIFNKILGTIAIHFMCLNAKNHKFNYVQ